MPEQICDGPLDCLRLLGGDGVPRIVQVVKEDTRVFNPDLGWIEVVGGVGLGARGR
jgi:hypothetical protein